MDIINSRRKKRIR